MKFLLQCQGFLISKSVVGKGQKLGGSSLHMFCGFYILRFPRCSL